MFARFYHLSFDPIKFSLQFAFCHITVASQMWMWWWTVSHLVHTAHRILLQFYNTHIRIGQQWRDVLYFSFWLFGKTCGTLRDAIGIVSKVRLAVSTGVHTPYHRYVSVLRRAHKVTQLPRYSVFRAVCVLHKSPKKSYDFLLHTLMISICILNFTKMAICILLCILYA